MINLQTYNFQFQYHFPNSLPYWVTAGYGQLLSGNMGDVNAGGGSITSATKIGYDQIQATYYNGFYDVNPNLRIGVEYAHIDTHYVDSGSAVNDRYQASTFFMF